MQVQVTKAPSRKHELQVIIDNSWQQYIELTDELIAEHIKLCADKRDGKNIDWQAVMRRIDKFAASLQAKIAEIADAVERASK